MERVFFYVFRHGETDWNAERRFQGHTDIPLNDKGREQARQLKNLIAPLRLEVILSSDLGRAHETARIASHGSQVPIVTTKNLREAFLGEPEGRLRDEIIAHYGPDQWQKWLSIKPEDMDFSFPSGESKTAQLKRILEFVGPYLKQNPLVKIAGISTHGGTLRRIIHHCEGAPTQPIPIPNCSLYKIEYLQIENRWLYHGPIGDVSGTEKLFK